jgi:hypothetical protein
MSSGDFPAVLYDVVSKRTSVIEGSLSVDDLNEILDELSKNMGKGSDSHQRVFSFAETIASSSGRPSRRFFSESITERQPKNNAGSSELY